jgi:hypothetical protein
MQRKSFFQDYLVDISNCNELKLKKRTKKISGNFTTKYDVSNI